MRVVDENGVVQSNLEKRPNGSIIVTDRNAYQKYVNERDLRLRVDQLEKKTDMILDLLSSINNKLK